MNDVLDIYKTTQRIISAGDMCRISIDMKTLRSMACLHYDNKMHSGMCVSDISRKVTRSKMAIPIVTKSHMGTSITHKNVG